MAVVIAPPDLRATVKRRTTPAITPGNYARHPVRKGSSAASVYSASDRNPAIPPMMPINPNDAGHHERPARVPIDRRNPAPNFRIPHDRLVPHTNVAPIPRTCMHCFAIPRDATVRLSDRLLCRPKILKTLPFDLADLSPNGFADRHGIGAPVRTILFAQCARVAPGGFIFVPFTGLHCLADQIVARSTGGGNGFRR